MADSQSDAHHCKACGLPGHPGANLFPYLIAYGPGGTVHHWLHQPCAAKDSQPNPAHNGPEAPTEPPAANISQGQGALF